MVVALGKACCEREGNFTGGQARKKFNGLMVTIDGIDSDAYALISVACRMMR